MKLTEALKHEGNPFWIPDCSRDDLPEFFKEMGFKKGVEVGVSWGQNIVNYCKAGLEIDGIDPWQDSRDNVYRKIISLPGKYAKNWETVYGLAQEMTKDYPNCKLIKGFSEQVIDNYPDRSLDFVYIDANHNFGYIAMDLMLWSSKVKRGGIIAGHDYYRVIPEGREPTRREREWRFVGHIVDAFAGAYDFKNFYVLGSKYPKEGERNDTHLSFMFIKHW